METKKSVSSISRLQAWLDTDKKTRKISTGASLIRQFLSHPVLAENFTRYPEEYMPMIERKLRQALQLRLDRITHKQVEQMRLDAAKIHEEVKKTNTEALLRTDHNRLPEDIRLLYDKACLMRKRILRLQAKADAVDELQRRTPSAICPDGEVYPLLKEMLAAAQTWHESLSLYTGYKEIPTDNE